MADVLLDRIQNLTDERERAEAAITDLYAEADGRDLSDAENDLLGRYRSRLTALEPDIDAAVADVERRQAAKDARALLGSRTPATVTPTAPTVAEPVYRTFAEYARDALITKFDYIAGRAGGHAARVAAQDRLERVVANTISSDVPGLLPPQYLTQVAQLIVTRRPIVSSARSVNLTAGTLTYPSITQRPTVGKQTAEKTEATSQKMTVAFVNVVADTYTGCGDLSWQVINWSTPDALQLFFDLMAEAYAKQTEAAAGTVLAAATLLASPTIPASPTIADWTANIAAAAGAVYAASGRPANTIYADLTTGYQIIGQASAIAPVFFAAGNVNVSTGAGNIAGLNLVLSAGLPAKTVVVGASEALMCAETAGAPVELRAVEPALGGLEVGVIGAFVAKITDAGGFRKLTIA